MIESFPIRVKNIMVFVSYHFVTHYCVIQIYFEGFEVLSTWNTKFWRYSRNEFRE